MRYDHLVEKIAKLQEKIMPAVDAVAFDGEEVLDLARSSEAAKVWVMGAQNHKLGEAEAPTKAPSIDPMMDFANALALHAGMFDEKTQSEIQEYTELIEELFDHVKA